MRACARVHVHVCTYKCNPRKQRGQERQKLQHLHTSQFAQSVLLYLRIIVLCEPLYFARFKYSCKTQRHRSETFTQRHRNNNNNKKKRSNLFARKTNMERRHQTNLRAGPSAFSLTVRGANLGGQEENKTGYLSTTNIPANHPELLLIDGAVW